VARFGPVDARVTGQLLENERTATGFARQATSVGVGEHGVGRKPRARDATKRPDHRLAISLTEVDAVAGERGEDVLALDEALSRLESIDPRASRVVELRYFTRLSEREAAEALGVSLSTLKRDWNFAKAWLLDQLGSGVSP
jgi:RNA polymerase sigma factor (sigma-70 family)